ncbi:hypothetical protein Tco_0814054 [Tanacetum coccineum]
MERTNGTYNWSVSGKPMGDYECEGVRTVQCLEGMNEQVVKEKPCLLVDTITLNVEIRGLSSYPPLLTQGSTPDGNSPGKSSYANVTEDFGNILVWVKLPGVSVTTFSEDGLSAIATKLGTPLMLDSYTSDMWLQSWGMSSYAREMIDLRADVKMKDTIVVEECPKNLGLGVAKNLKKPSQASKGVPVGSKVGLKPAKEYRLVSKKPTANSSSNKKKVVELTKEVSNSIPFDMLNLVDNDDELGTSGETSNLASNRAKCTSSSFWNVKTSSTNTTPIIEKIRKIEKLIIYGKVTLADDDGKPLKKLIIRVGFRTQSLLEQWSDFYENDDYNEEPYDDDMYEGQNLPDKLQEICDNLDIRIRGRRKKLFLVSFVV